MFGSVFMSRPSLKEKQLNVYNFLVKKISAGFEWTRRYSFCVSKNLLTLSMKICRFSLKNRKTAEIWKSHDFPGDFLTVGIVFHPLALLKNQIRRTCRRIWFSWLFCARFLTVWSPGFCRGNILNQLLQIFNYQFNQFQLFGSGSG